MLANSTGAWDLPETARDYARFAAACPLYREMADALAERLLTPSARALCDLSAGTGVSAEALLRYAHPHAELLAVEPAEAMLRRARIRLHDRRLRWLHGGVRTLRATRPAASFDAVACSSAFWLDPGPHEALGLIAELLRPGGRFGFSLPAEYLGEIEHLLAPEARAFASVLEEVRATALNGTAVRYPGGLVEATPLPGTREELREWLQSAGFDTAEISEGETLINAEDRARWYALPPIAQGWLPGVGASRSTAALRRLKLLARPLPPLRQVWLIVTATRAAGA